MARDIESLLRQQAALAAFGSYAFQETDLNKILTEAAQLSDYPHTFDALHHFGNQRPSIVSRTGACARRDLTS